MISAFIPFLFVLNGCSDAVQPIDPTMPASLVVTPAAPEVGVDSSVVVKAVAVNSNGNPVAAALRWSVSDSTVAAVSDSGVVSGRSAGTVTVSAVSGSAVGTTTIKVRQSSAAEPPVAPATGPGLSGVAFAYDDFTTYKSTAELIADRPSDDGTATNNPRYININNKYLLSLDPTVMYNGHPALKYSQPGGSDRSSTLAVPVSPNKASIWIRVKIRWSPGYTTRGTGFGSGGNSSAAAYKILGWGWGDGLEGRGTLDFSNTNQYQLSWDVRMPAPTGGQGAALGPFADLAAGNATAEWIDGAWYDYIVSFEKLSNTQTRSRVWIGRDGTTPVLRATVYGNVTVAGAVAPSVALVTLGMNFNQMRSPSQNQALWWGQWEVVDGSKYPNPFGIR